MSRARPSASRADAGAGARLQPALLLCCGRRCSRGHALAPLREAPVVVEGRARAFARDHAGPDRPLRRARRAENLALPRLDDALQDLAPLAGLGIRDPDAGNLVAELGASMSSGAGLSFWRYRGARWIRAATWLRNSSKLG